METALRLFKHLDDYAEIYVSSVLLLIFSILCIIQVVMRYVFNNSLTWSEELSRYAFVWFVYASASYAIRYRRHGKFNFLVNFFQNHFKSPIYSEIIKLIALVLWITFLIYRIYLSARLVNNQFRFGQVSPANHIPMYIVYLGLPLGALLMSFRVAQHIYGLIKEMVDYLRGKSASGTAS